MSLLRPLFNVLIVCWCGRREWKAEAQILTLIGSYLKCTEGIRGEILYSWECVLAPDKPPLHGFSILSWASNRTVRLNNLGERLASNGSGIHTLLKAIWQRFHTLISMAGALSGGEEDAKIRAGGPLDIPLTYKNVKQLSAQSQGGPAVLLPAKMTWGLCLFSRVVMFHVLPFVRFYWVWKVCSALFAAENKKNLQILGYFCEAAQKETLDISLLHSESNDYWTKYHRKID